jgi:hypothetical protein
MEQYLLHHLFNAGAIAHYKKNVGGIDFRVTRLVNYLPKEMATFWATFCFSKISTKKQFQNMVSCRYFKVSKVFWYRCFGLSNCALLKIFLPL